MLNVSFRAKTHERWIFMMINELPYEEYVTVLNMYLLKKLPLADGAVETEAKGTCFCGVAADSVQVSGQWALQALTLGGELRPTFSPLSDGRHVVHPRWLWHCLCHCHLVSGLICGVRGPLRHADSIRGLHVQHHQRNRVQRAGLLGPGFPLPGHVDRPWGCAQRKCH